MIGADSFEIHIDRKEIGQKTVIVGDSSEHTQLYGGSVLKDMVIWGDSSEKYSNREI